MEFVHENPIAVLKQLEFVCTADIVREIVDLKDYSAGESIPGTDLQMHA